MTALCRRAWSCSSNYSVQGGFGGWLVGDGGLSVAFFPFLSFPFLLLHSLAVVVAYFCAKRWSFDLLALLHLGLLGNIAGLD
jgi:hypothetical protein